VTPADGVGTAIPLLETKLRAPRPRRGVVPRPRLGDRMPGAHAPALTLVSAPAGFGKTTLVTEWIARTSADGTPVAWVSLDPNDDDPAVFLAYVVAALQRVAPGLGDSAVSLIRASPTAVRDATALLLNDLDVCEQDVVLVLDDYHVIETVALHEALAFLVERLPPHVRVVIASRTDPPLPLARLRARGDLHEIRAADLRFTADEATRYLNDSMGLELGTGDVAALGARTEGWIAALQLAALSMQGRDDIGGFIAGFTGDDRFVVDYLVEEVLERQTDDVRTFLLQTAVLDRLTGPLCDAVTGRRDGRATLETLERRNLFLVPLDDRREWYRYHHLFADVLRARLLDEQPDEVAALHRRAGDWYADHGEPAPAIAHAMSGRDHARAAELIELAATDMRRARQEATLRRWLEALPDSTFAPRPVLALALVGARMATGDTTGVPALLEGVEAWLDPHDDAATEPIVFDRAELARLPTQVAVYRSALALLAGDVSATTEHAGRALALADPTDHLARGSAAALLGLASWSVGDLHRARGNYADAVGCFVDAGYFPDVLGVSLALADIQIAQGRLGDAQRTYESGLRHAAEHAGLRGAADMHVGLAEVHFARDDLAAATRHLDASRALGEHAGLPQHAHRWRVAAARLHHAEGETDAALALLDEAARRYDTDFSPAVQPVPAVTARVHLACGDLDAADRWARDHGLGADDEPVYVREYEHITLVRVLLARRDPQSLADAAALAQRLLAAANDGGRDGAAIELLVLLSLVHAAAGDRDSARVAVEEALVRAEPEGYVRVFVEEGAAMTALLRSVAVRGAAHDHAQRVLASLRGGPPPPASPPARRGLVEDLSARELEVLRLLRSDLSGPDIARELYVSLNTMRTHTKNIYAKLGVTNRREAVRRADELGL
jgi:LuxR family maltose regulon positive regulatory protein